MPHDHKLVGALIKREVQPRYASLSAAARAFEIDRATMYRVYAGDPRIRATTHRRAELLLDLPYESLDLVREHDVEGLRRCGMRPDPLRWVLRQIEGEAAGGAGVAQLG